MVSRDTFVLVLTIVTVAPGAAAPLASFTLPTRVPYKTWAYVGCDPKSTARPRQKNRRKAALLRHGFAISSSWQLACFVIIVSLIRAFSLQCFVKSSTN